MEKSGIKAFLLSAAFTLYRLLVGDERFPFSAVWQPPLWVRHVIVFAVVFGLLYLDFWLMDLWEARREKKKLEKYRNGQS